ncbi:PaaI family thioesterase [Nocardioides sp.]|uniref:PaaI family thioesterase n=1 Tax=Nocardioides sp. TaxID=35761 RepID=UPI0027335C2C|nr:PaaI family thioesterase [Nocardioides sp.]MDP3891520.1 PaaI family thioesterase [Nocardioides sp.]
MTSHTTLEGLGSFVHEEIPTAEIDRLEEIHGPLVAAVRDLVDVTIRTRVDDAEVRRVTAAVKELTDRLGHDAMEGPAGVHYNSEGRSWNWGNAAVGMRNPVAPPLKVSHDDDGVTRGVASLGTPYEGPPGLVHGGASALLLDHLMGETASMRHSQVTFTGTLTMRYLAPLPLGEVRLEGRIERQSGRKVFVTAEISGPAGRAIEADGVFIVPRWAVRDGAGPA